MKRWLLAVAATGIGLVLVSRGREQWRNPGAMTARGETRWLGWAYRDPRLLGRLEAAEPRLPASATFCLEATRQNADSLWLRAMTNYVFFRARPDDACRFRVLVTETGEVSIRPGASH
jgi:hypothetical protein